TTLADHAQYDAFGNRLDAPTVDSLFAYTGRYHDDDTGLQWNGSTQGGGRWYDSATGRWLSEDSIGFRGDTSNLYRYVENGATIFVDPNGRELDWTFEPHSPGWADPHINPRPNGGQPAITPPPIPPGPYTPPGPGWIWKGPPYDPTGGPCGSWNSPEGDKLHPDLHHPQPKGPHWGWRDPYGNRWDYFPDTGKWVADPNNNPNKPTPVFPEGTFDTVVIVGGGVACGYVIYRVGRMLPSLIPPFWGTIPANAAIP
ncbi:MAG: hypothetical protein IT427_04630, partial [Pirellulales bacterium]|nr:hypothetical protein [Pirellulales bacterium]